VSIIEFLVTVKVQVLQMLCNPMKTGKEHADN